MGLVGDFADFQNGFAFKSKDFCEDGEYNVIKIKELKDGKIKFTSDTSKVKYVDGIEKYVVYNGDILFALTGDPVNKPNPLSWVGRVSLYKGDSNAVLNQRVCKVIPKEGLNPLYLYYFFRNDLEFYKLAGKATGSASQANISTKTISDTYIDLPKVEYQDRVVEILSSIDNKIEINERINDNLAEQAQGVLYNFMEQYKYQLNPLSDIAVVIDCLHSKKPSAIEDSTYQLIQLDNIRNDGFLDMSACKYMISQADYENWTRKCEIIEGDCVITNVGRIGAVSQAPYGTRAAMGRNMTCIRLKSGLRLQAYFITVLLSNHMRRQIQHNTDEGTIMGALNVKNIPKLLFPIFEASVMSDLESILYPLRKQIEYNNLQNQNLSQIRDALLPRLMSGEFDVSNLDI